MSTTIDEQAAFNEEQATIDDIYDTEIAPFEDEEDEQDEQEDISSYFDDYEYHEKEFQYALKMGEIRKLIESFGITEETYAPYFIFNTDENGIRETYYDLMMRVGALLAHIVYTYDVKFNHSHYINLAKKYGQTIAPLKPFAVLFKHIPEAPENEDIIVGIDVNYTLSHGHPCTKDFRNPEPPQQPVSSSSSHREVARFNLVKTTGHNSPPSHQPSSSSSSHREVARFNLVKTTGHNSPPSRQPVSSSSSSSSHREVARFNLVKTSHRTNQSSRKRVTVQNTKVNT